MKYGSEVKYFGGYFAWLKYYTYHLVPVLAPNSKQHSLAELYVRYVYLNLFGWTGSTTLAKHFKGGHKL
jgi:hypothetical protein